MNLSNQAESKFKQDDLELRSLRDHELDHVSGGRGPTIFNPPSPRGGRPG